MLLFKNPRDADAMTKVQAELDETKVILVSGQHLAINMEIARCRLNLEAGHNCVAKKNPN